jgi:(E)-4-hydroxy-3-methylbut-2-enyl-diphosphate synthase
MKRYCIDLTNYERFPSREVVIGNVPLGSVHPIRLQSMTNVSALDTDATVDQCMRIFNAGADYVRIAIKTIKEAENLSLIRKKLHDKSYQNPLIADVHFNPKIAETAARIVEKVRINPGNYIDKRANFKLVNYTDVAYNDELEKIRDKLNPLIKICKENGTAIRIGSNHGSLSDRIMSRYGNTAEGMVEAAMEYISIFVDASFKNLVVSMKASNVRVMVQASRLLNAQMLEHGWNFPQHLGVTEAGEGEDGRIRSALGIGSLLQDGIGDTIRVSLTEPPENEIVFAQKLISPFIKRRKKIQTLPQPIPFYDPYDIVTKNPCQFLPGDNITVIGNMNDSYVDVWQDLRFASKCEGVDEKVLVDYKDWKKCENNSNCIPVVNAEEIFNDQVVPGIERAIIRCHLGEFARIRKLIRNNIKQIAFLLITKTDFPIGEARGMFKLLSDHMPEAALILQSDTLEPDLEQQMIDLCFFPGAAMIDGIVNGISMNPSPALFKSINEINRNLLQACGYRRSKAEFISCPGCGRTNFDLEIAVRRVKHRLAHLKNLKIAVMGCIVNGPGEMADADYGYVGAGKGLVHLYKGKVPVKKHVSEGVALNELMNVIKENGDWQEPN